VEKQAERRILCGFFASGTRKNHKNRPSGPTADEKPPVGPAQTPGAERAPRARPPAAVACHNEIRRTHLSCAICEQRKEKRFCPAIHGRICPQCCGEQREIVLDCPSHCVYLRQAHEHEKPRSLEDLDPSLLFPQVEIDNGFIGEHEHLILGLTYCLAGVAGENQGMRDADLIAVLTALARNYETLANSGLHYEMPIASLDGQAMASEILKSIKGYRDRERTHLGYTRLRDSDVFIVLVFLVRMAWKHTSGRPKSRAFVDFLLRQFPAPASAKQEEAGRLIVP
jgi:hypothetical protein